MKAGTVSNDRGLPVRLMAEVEMDCGAFFWRTECFSVITRREVDSATIENLLRAAHHCMEFAHGFRPMGWRKTGA